MPRPFAVLVVSVALLARPSPAHTQVKPEIWQPKLEAWVTAVESHTPGRIDAAATTIGRWGNIDIAIMTPYLLGLIELLPPQPKVFRFPRGLNREDAARLAEIARRLAKKMDHTEVIKRGAMLHTTVMISGLAKDSYYSTEASARVGAQAGGRVIILGKDGEPHGFAVPPRHWEVARELLQAIRPSPIEEPFVRQWYRATTSFMFYELQWGEGEIHMNAARETIGPDAVIEFDTGCLYETFASPKVTTVMDALRRSNSRVTSARSPAEDLKKAEDAFREAVRLDPSFAEARLRLGRVLALRGRHDEAVLLLRPLATRGPSDRVRYFAALFLGDVEREAGNHEAAAVAFGVAASLFPRAQSPHLALSALAIQRADRGGAVAALQQLLQPSAGEDDRHDPWWTYRLGRGVEMDTLLNALWTAIPRRPLR